VLVLKAQREEARLGGAGAVASLLAALGARPIVVGVVGADQAARVVRRLVADFLRSRAAAASHGQNSHEFCYTHCALFAVDGRPTTVKERLIGQTASRHGQQMLRVDRESCEPLPDLIEEKLCVAALAALDDVQCVLISDYGKGVCTPKLLAEVIRAAGRRNLPVLVDPRRGADYAVYRGATLIKPNRHEAGEATGRRIHSRGQALAAGRELCTRYDFRAAVVTLDADGMVLATADGSPSLPVGEGGRNSTNGLQATSVEKHFRTRDREVADVTGAGDTVLAVLGTSLARGIDLARACELATAAAGLQVERLGVSPISWSELPLTSGEGRGEGGRNPENGHHSLGRPAASARNVLHALPRPSALPGARILTLAELSPLINSAHRSARTIVFTNGCFDLLHAGHIHCLAAAKALGDLLVVGLNSDASVRRLKGPSRPTIGEGDRAAMLAALACVDYVVIFDDDTPERLIAGLRPDILAKGVEPRPGPIPGESLVASYGGRLELIPPLPGISTTALLERIIPPLPPGDGQGEGTLLPLPPRDRSPAPLTSLAAGT
jgi:D-beta-D-heptose 7-phosphate kinase/D-beta-D-heptose 1-phosphate adenosyltransferase